MTHRRSRLYGTHNKNERKDRQRRRGFRSDGTDMRKPSQAERRH